MAGQFVVAVDARPLSHPQAGGFRTYVRALLTGMRECQEHGQSIPKLLLYVDRPLTPDVQAMLPPTAETRVLSANRIRTDLKLWKAQLTADQPDLVFGTQNYLPGSGSIPSVVVLHDAMGIKRYDWDRDTPRNLNERFINRYWYYLTVSSNRRARGIITVSNGSRDEIRTVLHDLPESRFSVVYNGVTLPKPTFVGDRDDNTVLCLASPDRRKNLALLYDSLSTQQQVFGGRPPALRVICTSATTASRTEAILDRLSLEAELLRNLDDQALANTYAKSTVFIWPSHLEGFGMPPLEMMQTGGVVASSNAVCMPEILGDAPIYFSPHDPEGLARSVNSLLQNPGDRHIRGERGQQLSRTYTCERMARETMYAWEKALQSSVR